MNKKSTYITTKLNCWPKILLKCLFKRLMLKLYFLYPKTKSNLSTVEWVNNDRVTQGNSIQQWKRTGNWYTQKHTWILDLTEWKSQTQKSIWCMIPFTWSLRRGKTNLWGQSWEHPFYILLWMKRFEDDGIPLTCKRKVGWLCSHKESTALKYHCASLLISHPGNGGHEDKHSRNLFSSLIKGCRLHTL